MNRVAVGLELRLDQLREWARQLGGRPGVGATEPPEQELRRLRRENAILKQEREFAEKSGCASRGSRVRYDYITRHRDEYPLRPASRQASPPLAAERRQE
jgi:transposase-like protein